MNAEENKVIADFSVLHSDQFTVEYLDNDFAIVNDVRDFAKLGTLQMGMNIILLCLTGKMQFSLNGRQIEVNERELAVIRSHVLVNNVMLSPDFQCRIACISDRLLKSQLRNHIDIWNKALYSSAMNIIKMPDAPSVNTDLFYDFLKQYLNAPRQSFHNEVIAGLVHCLLLDICGFIKDQLPEEASHPVSQENRLFNQFIQQLAETKIKRHSVGYYAESLCVTPKYLSSACKRVSGKTAMRWITEYVMEDIHYYLKETSLTIKEISAQMGFPNLSFFGKYVKQNLGLSPKAYRKAHEVRA